MLGHVSLDLPWWTRVCNCRFYHRNTEDCGPKNCFIVYFKANFTKSCVLHEETFIVEKA